MPEMSPRWMAIAVTFTALLLAACSSSDQTPSSSGSPATTQIAADQDRAVATVKQDLTQNDDPNELQFTDTEGDCTARATVDALGITRLQEVGMDLDAGTAPTLTAPPLTTTEADQLYAIFGRCADLKFKVATLLSADGQLSAPEATCVADRYESDGLLRRSLFSEFDPTLNDDIDQMLAAATEACT